MVFLIFSLLFDLTSKQELFLARQLCSNCKVIGVIAVKDQYQDKVADLIKNSAYYNFKIEIEYIKKSIDLPKSLQNLIDKKIEILWIFNDSVNGDPLSLRFLVTKTQELKIPIVCEDEKQLQFGATYLFDLNEEGQVIVKIKKAALTALKIDIPEKEGLLIKIIE